MAYDTEVVDYSIMDKAGIKVKDLIIAVDGVMVDDDCWALEKALAAIANGGSFTVTVERPGQKGTIDLVIKRYYD